MRFGPTKVSKKAREAALDTQFHVNHRFRDYAGFVDYVLHQMSHCTPDVSREDRSLVAKHLPNALNRIGPILDRARAFHPETFNHLHSLQYCAFLYLLSNEIWLKEGVTDTSERLFLLNRSMNSIDIYYKIRLPRVFFISHGLGSVLVDTHYGENFILFHNVTVGRVGEKIPRIGNNVILYPGSKVLGESSIGDNSVVSAGSILIDTVIPSDSIVFSAGSQLEIRKRTKNYSTLYLRDAPTA